MECPICQDNLIEGHGGPIALGCGHAMHKDCCLLWFNSSSPKTCPVCRQSTATREMTALQFKRKTLRFHANSSPRVQRFYENVERNRLYFQLRKRLMTLQKALARVKRRRNK